MNIVAIVSGNIGLNSHLFKIGKTESSTCRLCKEKEETPIHLIFYCACTVKEMYQLTEESKAKRHQWKLNA
ncbi:Uncharacterized protein FKW44_022817 [Caligus rogercresseyi]|uniref:Reverse transcriptase zinc-binding domain-containing protein n=1 Tax=Caligus rogercresseyi TaxID=217165 RepID=A0A7T8GNY9_CALRO|nr:Uncharacterized protein FKW44_022817 [Caligus rogercresseyi]